MKPTSSRCPRSADGNHKPEPERRDGTNQQILIDEEGRAVAHVTCGACDAVALVDLPVVDAWPWVIR